jgi:hypothetical protein
MLIKLKAVWFFLKQWDDVIGIIIVILIAVLLAILMMGKACTALTLLSQGKLSFA